MYPVYFSALLNGEDGRLLEIGEACISRIENKVTFKNEFVPLLKLDTVVEIVRVLGNRQLERFRGRVYLSSRNLLQIIEVDPAIIAKARCLFDINTYMPAYFALSQNKSPSVNLKKAEVVSGTIRYLSMDTIKISVLPYVGEGQYLQVDCGAPLELKSTLLQVRQRELLGRKAAILICDLVSIPPAESKRLQACVDLLSKLEEDVDTDSAPPEPDFRTLLPPTEEPDEGFFSAIHA